MRVLSSVAIALSFLTSAALAANPEGNWISEDGGTKVHLSTCGGNRLCATLIWLDHPIDPATGKPKTDKLNPDPAKRSRALIGLQVVNSLTPSGPNSWSGRSTTPMTAVRTKRFSGSRARGSPKCKAACLPCCARRIRGEGRTDSATNSGFPLKPALEPRAFA